MEREKAWDLLCEFTKSDGLRRHALAVEACVVAYARESGEDETKWSVTALLHDFDWEIHPDVPDHPLKGEPILAERGVDPEIRRAILSHADFSGVPREIAARKDAICLRRTRRIPHRLFVRQARTEYSRGGRKVGAEKTQGQSLRAHGESR